MKITESLGKEIRAKADAGESHRIIAEWCAKERGVQVSKAAVTKYLRTSGAAKSDNRSKSSKPPLATETTATTTVAPAKVSKKKAPTTCGEAKPAAKSRRGRPSMFTAELRESLLKDVEEGATFAIAAEANGISQATLSEWLQKGREGDARYSDFGEALTYARARYKKQAIERIRKGVLNSGDRDWKAELTVLERLYPDEFAPQQVVNVKLEKEMEQLLEKLEKKLPPELYDLVESAIIATEEGDSANAAE
jgi:hypothetical protein